MIGTEALAVIIGYLLGSIPSAYIAGRLRKGVDIRKVGGGNMGALNTAREIGIGAGVAVLIVDIAKGSLAVLIARWLGVPMLFVFIAGFTAIVGHNFPVFIKFRGGKGAATVLGVLLALAPVQLGISLAIIGIVISLTRNITLSLAVGLALLPLIIWLFGESISLIWYALALAILLGLRYLPNTRRALANVEGKKNILVEKRFKPWQTRRD